MKNMLQNSFVWNRNVLSHPSVSAETFNLLLGLTVMSTEYDWHNIYMHLISNELNFESISFKKIKKTVR